MNPVSIYAIFTAEMGRLRYDLVPNLISPAVFTSLYFVVFGPSFNSRPELIGNVSYGAYIVPGLILFSVVGDALFTAAVEIFAPKVLGTIYEVLCAPISPLDILAGYIGAAVTKSLLLGSLLLLSARMLIEFNILHPFWMIGFFLGVCVAFAFLGILVGIWADRWQKVASIPSLLITPLVILGGTFNSTQSLPPTWRAISQLNPFVYLISGFRWTFYGVSDQGFGASLGVLGTLLVIAASSAWLVLHTGYKLRL